MQNIQPRPGEWSVEIRADGRNGIILYREYPWAAGRRAEILKRIATR